MLDSTSSPAAAAAADRGRGDNMKLRERDFIKPERRWKRLRLEKKGYFPPIRKLWQPPIKMSPAQFPWLPELQSSSSSRPQCPTTCVNSVLAGGQCVSPQHWWLCPKSCNHSQPFVSVTPPPTPPTPSVCSKSMRGVCTGLHSAPT